MKTIMSQIKSREELESILNEVTVTEKYDWSYEVTIDQTSKKENQSTKTVTYVLNVKVKKVANQVTAHIF